MIFFFLSLLQRFTLVFRAARPRFGLKRRGVGGQMAALHTLPPRNTLVFMFVFPTQQDLWRQRSLMSSEGGGVHAHLFQRARILCECWSAAERSRSSSAPRGAADGPRHSNAPPPASLPVLMSHEIILTLFFFPSEYIWNTVMPGYSFKCE